ncbi:MAG: ankyrin repeat domain-containing protein [Gemmataceae bacterium]
MTPMLLAAADPVVLDDATKAKLRAVAFQAARDGDVKTLTEYFAVGMPVNAANERGDSLLILAVYHGHAEAAGLILKQPKVDLKHRNRMGFTALDGAAFKGSAALVKALVKAGAEVNGKSPAGRR